MDNQDDQLPDVLKPEDRANYEKDAAQYFRNLGSTKTPGLSADELAAASRHLPSKQREAAFADEVDLASNKTRRSGARVNNSSAVPAIFMQGLSETSALIDKYTPGHLEAPKEMKPPDQQTAPTGFFHQAEAVVEGFCLDCQQAPDKTQYVLGVTIAKKEDSVACAGRVGFGATVLYTICMPCFEAAKELARDKTPLVLVFDGELVPDTEVQLARKYNFPVSTHTGTEKSRGQWELIKRAERLMDTLWEFIRQQSDDSLVFTRNRKVNA